MRRRFWPDDAGFTLLEVLVAVFVLGVVLLLLTQGMQFGLRASQLQANLKERKGELEAIDRALRQMVALADPGSYPEPATLRGTAQRMSFTTELPLLGDSQGQRADVALSAEAGRLLLRWTPHRHVALFSAPPAAQETLMLDGIERLEFAYQTTAGWSSSWTADTLPSLVRIRIVFPGRSGRQWPPLIVAPIRKALEE